jgi:hypothetical protein
MQQTPHHQKNNYLLFPHSSYFGAKFGSQERLHYCTVTLLGNITFRLNYVNGHPLLVTTTYLSLNGYRDS